jgi:hypothetical protein
MGSAPVRIFSIIFTGILCPAMLCAQSFVKSGTAGLYADSLVSRHSIWFDQDNDGDLDLAISNIYNRPNIFYTAEKGSLIRTGLPPFTNDGGNSAGITIADADHDRDLDMFVFNIFGQKNEFYLNQQQLLEKQHYLPVNSIENNSFHASFIDFDNDGDPDLFICDTELWNNRKSKRKPLLYENKGQGQFVLHTLNDFSNAALDTRFDAWGDYNNDGYMDLFLCHFGSPNTLYKNRGDGTFEIVNGVFSVPSGDSNSAEWVDIDNDGDLDLYVVNVRSANELYLNNNDGTFTRNENSVIVTEKVVDGHCNWTDLNNDGFPDLFGNDIERTENTLYLNQPNANHWLRLKLRGDLSNTFGIGARVALKANIRGKSYWQYRELQSRMGRPQANGYDLYFGLGDAVHIDSLQITWPSGYVQTFTKLSADQLMVIEEGAKAYTLPVHVLTYGKEDKLKDVSVRLVNDSIRIGEINSISIFYENKGLLPVDITIRLELNDNFVLNNSYPKPVLVKDNRYEWTIPQVPAGRNGVVTTAFFVKDDLSIADTDQYLRALIFPLIGDEQKSDNTVLQIQRIPLKIPKK